MTKSKFFELLKDRKNPGLGLKQYGPSLYQVVVFTSIILKSKRRGSIIDSEIKTVKGTKDSDKANKTLEKYQRWLKEYQAPKKKLKFIGSEFDPEYYKIAKKRLE
jgi:hypothetical protein